ncbi:MAG: hypothetical protein ABSF24_12000 [Candidatus Bathyarchaeia archaeon]|jgi:hypothetical protein
MKRKVVLVLCILLVMVILVSSMVYYFWYVPYVHVPQALGRQYMSVSFWPEFIGDIKSSPTPLHLNYEGNAMNVTYVSIEINVTNSYFQPVYINFSGFDVVWLIYKRTVTDPSDVLSNRDSLVWGAYYYLVYEAISNPRRGIHDFAGDDLEFYSANRNNTNFQTDIPSGSRSQYYGYALFDDHMGGEWYGQYYSNPESLVSPGTYFMYCIIYDFSCTLQNITITSAALH